MARLLATRLREAREARGLTQSQAAEDIDLPRTAVTQIEAGNRSVSTLELTKLAKLYRHSVLYFLEEVPDADENLNKMLYRAKSGSKHLQQFKEQISHYINLCKEGMFLEKLLQFDTRLGPPKYDLPMPKNKAEAVSQGEFVAKQERSRLGLGVNPIGDLATLIAHQGIWACSADLPDDVSGLFFNTVKTGMIILVNAAHVKVRKRFSYAHEYAHALFDRDEDILVSSKKNSTEYMEVRANAFAAGFLISPDSMMYLLELLNKGRSSRDEQIIFDVSANNKIEIANRTAPFSQNITFQNIAIIAHYFGASYQTTVYRLRSLHIISMSECDKLLSDYPVGKKFLSSMGALNDMESKEKDENQWGRELRVKLAYLVVEAYRRGEISRGRVIELGDEIGIGGKVLFDFALVALDKNRNNKKLGGSSEVKDEQNDPC